MSNTNDILLSHIRNPRNACRLENPDGVGKAGGNACPDTITFYVRIQSDIITEIKFEFTGCDMAKACGSITTELAKGKHADEAAEITADTIASALGGLEPDQRHLAQTAAEALSNAIWDYVVKVVGKTLEEF